MEPDLAALLIAAPERSPSETALPRSLWPAQPTSPPVDDVHAVALGQATGQGQVVLGGAQGPADDDEGRALADRVVADDRAVGRRHRRRGHPDRRRSTHDACFGRRRVDVTDAGSAPASASVLLVSPPERATRSRRVEAP